MKTKLATMLLLAGILLGWTAMKTDPGMAWIHDEPMVIQYDPFTGNEPAGWSWYY